MNSKNSVSIITVCFNSLSTVEHAINSVLNQDYENIEYIIIDGGSTDGTLEVLNRYKGRVTTILSEPDKGIYDAMNKGISGSTGDIIGILNSDDIYASDHEISEVVNQFNLNIGADILFGNIEFRNFSSNSVVRYYSSEKFKPFKLRFGWMPPHPATFVRRRLYESYGLYKIDYKISADYEKFVKWLLVERSTYVHLGRTIVHMRTGGASTAGLASVYTLNKEIVRACRSNGIYTNIFFLLFKFPFKFLELFKKPKTN